MSDNQNQQEHLKAFEAYFPLYSENHGVLKEIKADLEKIKKLTDINQQYEESDLVLSKHIYNEGHAESHWNNGKLWEIRTNAAWEATLGKYKKLINELRKVHFETLKKINATTCAYCHTKNLTNPCFYLKGTEYEKVFCNQACLNEYLAPCDECGNSRCGANWQRTDQDDDKRFCSKECFSKHYNKLSDKKKIAIKAIPLIHNTIERERERAMATPNLITCLGF